jgi:hypothetical protein
VPVFIHATWRMTPYLEKVTISKKENLLSPIKRIFLPLGAFLLGSAFIATFYIGILTWAQGWEYAAGQLSRDRWYVLPIIIGFGIQAALYTILRFQLFVPATSTRPVGALTPVKGIMGASGGTSATAMVACCIHHVTDVLPILGLSAAASFLTRYQRPFMLVGLAINIVGIIVMFVILYRERQKLQPVLEMK